MTSLILDNEKSILRLSFTSVVGITESASSHVLLVSRGSFFWLNCLKWFMKVCTIVFCDISIWQVTLTMPPSAGGWSMHCQAAPCALCLQNSAASHRHRGTRFTAKIRHEWWNIRPIETKFGMWKLKDSVYHSCESQSMIKNNFCAIFLWNQAQQPATWVSWAKIYKPF